VVPGPDAHAVAGEDLGDVVRVHAVHRERDKRAAGIRLTRPQDVQALDPVQALERVRGQRALVRADLLHADALQEADRGAQSRRLGDRRRARLELPRQLVEARGVEVDRADHVAAGQERRHRLQDLAAPVEHTEAGRAVGLVRGPHVEVGADRAHVDRELRHGLRAVDQRGRAGPAGAASDLGHGVDRAQDVGHVDGPDEPHAAVGQAGVELVERELPVVVDLQVADLRADLLAQELPGHDVGVVLHLGEHDRVARADVAAAPGVSHEVDRLRGVLREDRLLRRRAQPGGGALPPALVEVRRLHRERIDAAVDVRVVVRVVVRDRVDDHARLLRGRARVQVHEPLALQHRELAGQRDVGEGGGLGRHRHAAAEATSSRIHP
jgi:hypothetical protein